MAEENGSGSSGPSWIPGSTRGRPPGQGRDCQPTYPPSRPRRRLPAPPPTRSERCSDHFHPWLSKSKSERLTFVEVRGGQIGVPPTHRASLRVGAHGRSRWSLARLAEDQLAHN